MTRILITSALPYINGVKHLGNLVGSMLPADVYSRFQRQVVGRDNVLFICATDEHGTPAELAALDEGRTVEEYCSFWHERQKEQYERFGLSFDYFGRSSSLQNRKLTQEFARKLWEAGFLYERTTKQVYSPADGRFLPDRYVIGVCPHCGYDRARGDQCENCTRVLDPADLINPRSVISGSPDIEIRDSKHLFLRQTAFIDTLRSWIDSNLSSWPTLVTSIALKWLDEGLQDRGITRDLNWGVPVNAEEWGPNPEGNLPDTVALRGKVFYVWFDAPIEYIAATWEWADANAALQSRAAVQDEWQRWWKGKASADVRYVEFMGKDNVPFHTVGFPCTIFGINTLESPDARWKTVDYLKGFNWLNYYGGKFSTSQKRGVFLDDALDLLSMDYWRWYLIANAPESADSSFSWEQFQLAANKDLADVLGNFVNRILTFCASRFGNEAPAGGEWGPLERELVESMVEKVSSYTRLLSDTQFRRAAAELRGIWSLGNEYLVKAAPWVAIKKDRDAAAAITRFGLNLVRLFALLSAPIMPMSSEQILSALRLPAADRWPDTRVELELAAIQPGQPFDVPPVLFIKIDDAKVAEWIGRFGGAQEASA